MKYKILAVDDLEENLVMIKLGLRKHSIEIIPASSGEQALHVLEEITPDLILMDIQMPGLDGFKTTQKIKAIPRLASIPVIFLSALKDLDNIVHCFEVGGVDYVSKPFKNPELVARINTHLKIRNLQRSLEIEHQKANAILENMLPASYIDELKNGRRPKPVLHKNVVVFFTDFKNFTTITRDLGPESSIGHLNEIFYAFDEIVACFNLERVKTIGDGYFAVGAINTRTPDTPIRVVAALLKMQEFVRFYNSKHNADIWHLRTGAHIGDVIAGVVGYQKIAFDVWGTPVNVASRLQSVAETSGLVLSGSFLEQVRDQVLVAREQTHNVHNMGDMKLYYVEKLSDSAPEYIVEMFGELQVDKLGEGYDVNEDFMAKLISGRQNSV